LIVINPLFATRAALLPPRVLLLEHTGRLALSLGELDAIFGQLFDLFINVVLALFAVLSGYFWCEF
jgi:hypothetical protein